MSRFSKLRELLTLSRALETEGRRLRANPEGRAARFIEAAEYRLKAERLAGRITDEECWTEMRECLDAKQDAVA